MSRSRVLVPVAVLGLLRAQAWWGRRRHGYDPPPDPVVDLVVPPTSGAAPAGTPYRLVALGDSAMSGVGADSLDGILSVQVATRLADALGRLVHVTSHARAGAQTRDVLREQVPQMSPADGIVLLVGTNDVVHRTGWWALRRDTAELLDTLTGTGAPVVMSNLPEFRAMRAIPRPLREAVSGYARTVNAIQRKQADTRPMVTLVDVRSQAGPTFRRRPAMLSADSFHPSSRGYALIADSLAPALAAQSRFQAAEGAGCDPSSPLKVSRSERGSCDPRCRTLLEYGHARRPFPTSGKGL
jgi:lysophospholipase L1-like esterase